MKYLGLICYFKAFVSIALGFSSASYAENLQSILKPGKEVIVKSTAQGIVNKIHVKLGENLKNNDIIIEIDNKKETLEANLAKVEYTHQRAEVYKSGKISKYLSKEELAKKRLDLAKKKANLDLKNFLLEQTTVKAPIAGTVVSLEVQKGASVSVGDEILKIVDLKGYYFDLNVPERYIHQFPRKKEISFQIESTPKVIKAKGKVEFVSPVVDSASGTIHIRVTLKDDSKIHSKIRPGAVVKVQALENRALLGH